MNNIIYTLHDFLLHTESIVFIIMGISLLSMVGFWLFLTARDEDKNIQ
ncbi:MAG: hypothetical protein K9L30_16595 [Desulfobacterales bacterium]|nr:hypothetical protein [Desulfobacterales bacterium]